jgi:hypothetical protein
VAKTKDIFGELPAERQARVMRAVLRGEVLVDPEEAAVAVRYARSLLERQDDRFRWLRWLAGGVAFTYILVELIVALGRHDGVSAPNAPTLVLFFYLLSHVYGWSAARRTRENARRAERLNLQLAQWAGLWPEESEPTPTELQARVAPAPVQAPEAAGQWSEPSVGREPSVVAPALRRPSASEVLLALSVAALLALALLPDRGAPTDGTATAFGLIACAALASAIGAILLAYKGRQLTATSERTDAVRETEMLVGLVAAAWWSLMLLLLPTDTW